jgi:hypothetical protein
MSFNLREHVVDNVVLNDTVEDVASNEAKFTVNSRKRALDKRPVVGIVVSGLLMGVVQVGNSNYSRISKWISGAPRLAKTYQSSGSSKGKEVHTARMCS